MSCRQAGSEGAQITRQQRHANRYPCLGLDQQRSLQSAGAGQLVAGITASAGAVHQAASSTASAGAEHLAASSTASAGAGHLAADSMSSTAEVPGCSGPMWSLPERRHCAARCRQPCGSRAAFSSS